LSERFSRDLEWDLLARLVPSALIIVGIVEGLRVEGAVGVVTFPLGLLALLLAILGRTMASSFLGLVYVSILAVTGDSRVGLLAPVLGVWLVYTESPSISLRPVVSVTLRALPFWLYGAAIILFLRSEWFSLFGEEGYFLAILAGTVYFSLAALWTFLPGRAVPDVASIGAWLRRNRILPLEILVLSIILVVAIRVSMSSLLGVVVGLPAYAWARGLGAGREVALLIFTLAYVSILWLLGLVPLVDSFFSI
jgi:hypothetical protein